MNNNCIQQFRMSLTDILLEALRYKGQRCNIH
jgi:hypothetical protein